MKKKLTSLTVMVFLLLTPWFALISAESSSPLQADAGGPYIGTAGIPIQFDGSNSISSNGSITTFEWYCGDGSAKTGMNPTHTYTHPGTYTLTLTIKDEENNCGTDTTQVIIHPDNPPTASFIQPVENTVYFRNTAIGQTATSSILIGPSKIIVNAEDDIGVREVEFYIDDTLKHIDDEAPYEYTWKTGHFSRTIKAVIIDTSGQRTSIEQTVFKWKFHPLLILSLTSLLRNGNNENNNILPWIPENDIDASLLMNLLKVILLQNEESNSLFPLLKHLLLTDEDSFNLADFLEKRPLLKNYVNQNYPLIYRLILLSSDSNENDRFLKNDNTILRAIMLAMLKSTFLNDDSTSQQEENNYYDSSSFSNWLKDHPAFTIGSAFLLLTLIRRLRNKDIDDSEDTIEDIVRNYDPVARAGGPYTGIAGEPITLSAENSYDDDGRIVSFNWEFGDGNSGSGEIVTHTYLEPGEYTISLTITDNDGAKANDTTTIKIFSTSFDESSQEKTVSNAEFWIISGGLSSILAVGLVVLKFRRRLFE
jgi:PKD repeat protein